MQPGPNRSTLNVGIIDLSRSVMMYAMAGAVGTSMHFIVLIILEPLSGPIVATTIGATCGALTNFVLARRYVFQSNTRAAQTLPRFIIVALIGLIINAATMALLIPVLPLLISQMFASSLVLLTGFTINRFWTFR